MASVSDVLRVAAGEIGYSRWTDPQAGTKYGRWYAQQTGSSYYGESNVPYCAMFVSWVLHQCGVNFTYAYCPYILRDFASKQVNMRQAQPGDIVLFDWNCDGVCDHVGFVEVNKGSYLQTIEGNTSSSSNANGGNVARRTRNFSYIKAVVRLDLAGSATVARPSTSTPSSSTSSGLGDTRVTGPLMIKECQRQCGTPVDGIISGQTAYNKSRMPAVQASCIQLGSGGSQLITRIQHITGADADGYMGEQSVKALQRWLNSGGYGNLVVDGYWGTATSQAFGKALQAGAFRS